MAPINKRCGKILWYKDKDGERHMCTCGFHGRLCKSCKRKIIPPAKLWGVKKIESFTTAAYLEGTYEIFITRITPRAKEKMVEYNISINPGNQLRQKIIAQMEKEEK